MRRVLLNLCIATATLMVGVPLKAETVGGVSIKPGNDLSDYINVKPSFIAYKKYLDSITPKGQLHDSDYYVSINILEKANVTYSCHNKFSSVPSAEKGLFGGTDVSFVVVNLSVSRPSAHLGEHEILTDIPVILAGENFDKDTNKQSNGTCFFIFTPLRSAHIRHEGETQNDFDLRFKINTANKINYEFIGTLTSSFITLIEAFNPVDVSGARTQQAKAAITNVQTAVESAFSSKQTSLLTKPLASPGERDLIYNIVMPGMEIQKLRLPYMLS
jgi:hypothetical protein